MTSTVIDVRNLSSVADLPIPSIGNTVLPEFRITPTSFAALTLEQLYHHHQAATSVSVSRGDRGDEVALIASERRSEETLPPQAPLTFAQIQSMTHHFQQHHPNDNKADNDLFLPQCAENEPFMVLLASIYGRAFGPAMRILASAPSHIKFMFTRNTGRIMISVSEHECMGFEYCSCTSFKYTVCGKGEAQHCKHLLALSILYGFDRRRLPRVLPPAVVQRLALSSQSSSQQQSASNLQVATRPTALSSAGTHLSPVVSAMLQSASNDAAAAKITCVDDSGYTWTEVAEDVMASLFAGPAAA